MFDDTFPTNPYLQQFVKVYIKFKEITLSNIWPLGGSKFFPFHTVLPISSPGVIEFHQVR